MKLNKIILIISGVAVLVLIAASVLLFQSISQFRDVSGQLNLSRQQLADLYSRDPFPSDDNITLEQENLERLRREWAQLMTDVADGQIEPVQTSATRFLEMLRDKTRDLTEAADRRGVGLPADIAFGFQRHRTGELPASGDVPRLIKQLLIIEQLANTLYDVRVERINGISRQEFEAPTTTQPATPPPGGGGIWSGAPAAPQAQRTTTRQEPPEKSGILVDGKDYTSMRFSLDVVVRENNLRDLLNSLVSHPMFIVVTEVEIENPFVWRSAAALRERDRDRSRPADASAAEERRVPSPPDAPLARSARIATGMQSPFRVRIDLLVYRFRKDEAS